jgi:hypothetical protein
MDDISVSKNMVLKLFANLKIDKAALLPKHYLANNPQRTEEQSDRCYYKPVSLNLYPLLLFPQTAPKPMYVLFTKKVTAS